MARSAPANSLTRRIGTPGLPAVPSSVTTYNPAVDSGPSGSGLANVQPRPLVDVRSVVPGQTPPAADNAFSPPAPDKDSATDVLSRALIGFSHGFDATPAAAGYSPVAAGIAGGISGAGRSFKDALDRRLAAAKPYQDAQGELLKEAAKRQAADPYEAANQSRTLDRELQVAREKSRLNAEMIAKSTGGLKPADALAINKQAEQDILLRGVDPSSDEYGNALAARVSELATQARALGATKVTPTAPPAPKKPAGRPSLDSFVK